MDTLVDYKTILAYLQNLIKKGGPEPTDYQKLNDWYNLVWTAFENKEISLEQIEELRNALNIVYGSLETLFGQVFTAPYGYRGDFEIIDKIYKQQVSTNDNLANWDRYFLSTPAVKAVINRKEYFKKLLTEKAKLNPELRVLNLASGPCRDLKEFYENSAYSNVAFDCLEFDPKAIAYAKKILGPNQRVNFIQKNIFKFTTFERYDLVWSAGLFDYFEDLTFTSILTSILDYTTENGEIVIGNFHPRNPTRKCMEFTLWQLHHRDENKLKELAINAGVSDISNVSIDEESERINLFMRIKRPTLQKESSSTKKTQREIFMNG